MHYLQFFLPTYVKMFYFETYRDDDDDDFDMRIVRILMEPWMTLYTFLDSF
jgi:hypothetical protein